MSEKADLRDRINEDIARAKVRLSACLQEGNAETIAFNKAVIYTLKTVLFDMRELEAEYQEFDPEPDDYGFEQDPDHDSGMSYSQQCYSDRGDYANELLRSGKICEIQAAEMRVGA